MPGDPCSGDGVGGIDDACPASHQQPEAVRVQERNGGLVGFTGTCEKGSVSQPPQFAEQRTADSVATAVWRDRDDQKQAGRVTRAPEE